MLLRGVREIFHRPPGRYEAVDGIRALSVVWIVFFHVFFALGDEVSFPEYERAVHAPWNWIWSKGFLGINPFFVISGFLIADMLLRELERGGSLDLRAFYLRRWTRLAPAYYLVLAGFVLFHRWEPQHYSLDRIWSNFVWINNWFSLRDQPATWSWSLAVEEQFYLLCPLFILALWRTRGSPAAVIATLIALSMAYTFWRARTVGPFKLVYHWRHDPEAFFTFFDTSYAHTLSRVSALWMGVGCAYLARSERWMARFRSSRGSATLLGLFLAVTVLTLNPWVNPPSGTVTKPFMTMMLNPISAFSFACLLLLVQANGRWARAPRRLLASPALYPLAQVSYGTYLLHAPVTDAFFRRFPAGPRVTLAALLAQGLAVLAVAFLLAMALFVVVEAPGRRFGHRLLARRRARRTDVGHDVTAGDAAVPIASQRRVLGGAAEVVDDVRGRTAVGDSAERTGRVQGGAR